jgi:hypothetical protein
MPEQLPIIDALQTSVIINRRDFPGQIPWTEWRAGVAYGCPANPGDLVGLSASGKIDPCLLPATASQVYVNGNAVPFGPNSPNFNNNAPAAPAGYTNVLWQFDVSGNISAAYATSGTVVSFGQITSGTNLGQTLIVGDGTSLTVACPGTGVIEATELATDNCTPVVTNISHPTHAGQLLISQPGNTSAAWADPQIQGLYAAGSTICPAPAYVAPTCIQPILIGGADCAGKLQNISVTTGGEFIVLAQDQETDTNVLRFAATTGNQLKTNATSTLTPLLSIRPKVAATTVIFTFRNSDFLSGGNLTHYQLLLNATLTGANFVNVDTASNAQYDISAVSYSGGRIVDAGYVGADHERNEYEFHFGFTGGTPDTITLVYVGAISTNTPKSNGGCSFAWDEQSTCL